MGGDYARSSALAFSDHDQVLGQQHVLASEHRDFGGSEPGVGGEAEPCAHSCVCESDGHFEVWFSDWTGESSWVFRSREVFGGVVGASTGSVEPPEIGAEPGCLPSACALAERLTVGL